MKLIDNLLNQITMYRLLLYYLIGLLVIALGLSVFGVMHYSPLNIIMSSVFLYAVCHLSNEVFAWAFKAPANSDSAYITALILALIITPTTSVHGLVFLAAAGVMAMASKYLLNINGRHIFNPAAIAVLLTSIIAGDNASWWVGSASMLPFVIIGGLLVMRKTRRTLMVFSFLASALVSAGVYSALAGNDPVLTLQRILLSSALFFLAFVMLTEPLTSPGTRAKQGWYGAIVGIIFPPQAHLGAFFSTPELALVIGNFFTYLAEKQVRLLPKLVGVTQIAPDTYDFVFTPNRPLKYTAGQYMEWTLPHKHNDARGSRRIFTLASSPTEPEMRIGVKFYPNSSSFKRTLAGITPTTPIASGQLGGDFTLPRNTKRKLAFIAGGIGVTPYRSMVKYLLDTNQSRSVTMLYAARDGKNVVYSDVFEDARAKLGFKTTYVLSQPSADYKSPFVRQGEISAELIEQEVPDFRERLFYVSGPPGMVNAIKAALHKLGVASSHVKTDLFTGY